MVIHANRIRRCGNASTASGTSHSENCGLHTLLVIRKAASTRSDSCATRGRRAEVRAMEPIAGQGNTNRVRTHSVRCPGGCQKPRSLSKPCQPVKDLTTLYSES